MAAPKIPAADAIAKAIAPGPDAPECLVGDAGAVRLAYASPAAHDARVSADVEALRKLCPLSSESSADRQGVCLAVDIKFVAA